MSDAGEHRLVPSAESFREWAIEGFAYLRDSGFGPANLKLQSLYNNASAFGVGAETPSEPLSGIALYRAMATYIGATIPLRIELQTGPPGSWPDITASAGELRDYYSAQARFLEETELGKAPPEPAVPEYAHEATTHYLHVLPREARERSDWRIGLNVLPQSIAEAMTALAPLIEKYPAICDIKFQGPASTLKPDSVIVYVSRDADRYDDLQAEILRLAETLKIQPRVGAIWDEIAPGIGLAAEAPPGESFLRYRCLVFYLAFLSFEGKLDSGDFALFWEYLRKYAAMFGLDIDRPHLQLPLDRTSQSFQMANRRLRRFSEAWR
ncbi:MAG: T3SS effector HopA1 family protein [Rhizomicrobium sp.]